MLKIISSARVSERILFIFLSSFLYLYDKTKRWLFDTKKHCFLVTYGFFSDKTAYIFGFTLPACAAPKDDFTIRHFAENIYVAFRL